ncbi:MAG: T9SS type A sorting domain-containing protein [Bacteroidota bacterium]
MPPVKLGDCICRKRNSSHATTSITLQVNSNLVGKELIIYDAVGKVIHQQKVLSTQTPISLNQMASGNYMLRIGEEVKQFEIIK